MSERDDEVEFTARVLDASAQVSVADERGGERAEIERAAQALRLTLRNTDVAGLDASMREAILRRADRRSRVRTWPLLLAASLGGAVVAAVALYFGVMVPAQQAEAARLEQERVAVQQVAAERERQAEERVQTARREAEVAAKRLAEQRAAMAAQAWADTAAAREAASAAAQTGGGGAPAVGGRASKSAAHRPRGAAASSDTGGCDPNDPLCGL